MKTKELHELTVDELNTKLKELSDRTLCTPSCKDILFP